MNNPGTGALLGTVHIDRTHHGLDFSETTLFPSRGQSHFKLP